jgi:hypothetical protein
VKPVAFAMAPISTELSSGKVDVTSYDALLQPTKTSRTFVGIALDDWMRSFLFAMESLLSPSSTPVIAKLPRTHNPNTPIERLMTAKEAIAGHLAKRVVPVFEPEDGVTHAWKGDLESAQDKFEQSLLEDISCAYRIGFMELHIDLGAEGNPVDDADEPYGYVPSSWLRFVLNEDDPLINHPLVPTKTPIVLHEFPPIPTIFSQTAKGVPEIAGSNALIAEIIDDALKWDYTLTVAARELAAEHDDLWLTIAYNLPGTGGLTHAGSETGVEADPPSALFAALARFTIAYQSVNHLLSGFEVGAKKTPDATMLANLAAILADLAEGVSKALADSNASRPAARATAFAPGSVRDAPTPFTETYVVGFLHAEDKENPHLTVYAKVSTDADKVVWPVIDGSEGTPAAGPPVTRHGLMTGLWRSATYPYTPPTAGTLPKMQMQFKWSDLDILKRQTVRPQIQVVRNANLARAVTGKVTNPALIYRTPVITGTRLVPYIDVAQPIDVPFKTDLKTTLNQILEPLLSVGATTGNPPKLKVGVGYEYALGESSSDTPLVATNAVLLVDGLELVEPGGSGTSISDFTKNIADQFDAWMKTTGANASLPSWITLSITFFIELNQTELPLIDLACVKIPLPKDYP